MQKRFICSNKYCRRKFYIELENNGQVHNLNKICSACGNGMMEEFDDGLPDVQLD